MNRIQTDIRFSFEQLAVQFQNILNEYEEEFESILKDTIEDFDFEKTFKEIIETKIEDALDKAFSQVDISEALKDIIWKIIDKKLSTLEENI